MVSSEALASMNNQSVVRLVAVSSTTLLVAVMFFPNFALAQEEQTVTGTYMALALAVISLMSNVFNFYMAEKAKRIGLNPNSTDEKIMNAFLTFGEKFKNSEEKVSNLTEFVYSALPKEAQEIVDKPAIQIRNVTKDVVEADAKVQKFRELYDAVATKVNK